MLQIPAKVQKFQQIFDKFSYVFVLQHNNLSALHWKKLKNNLQKSNHQNTSSLHIIPRKMQVHFPYLNFQAPLCFFGSQNPQGISYFLKSLQDLEFPKYSFIPLGLLLASKENLSSTKIHSEVKTLGRNFEFYDTLAMSQISSNIHEEFCSYTNMQMMKLPETLNFPLMEILQILENTKLHSKIV